MITGCSSLGGMKCVRVHRRTAVIGVTMYDLGIIADAIDRDRRTKASSPMEVQSQLDSERLYRQVTDLIGAMDNHADAAPGDIPER